MLEAHPDNAKALFRRGVASIHLNKTEQAEWDLTRAQEINPGGNIHNSPLIHYVAVTLLYSIIMKGTKVLILGAGR